MTISTPGQDRHRDTVDRDQYVDATGALYRAVGRARRGLNAGAAAIYLLDEPLNRLLLAMAGGSAPSLFTFPGRMELDSPSASVTAFTSGQAATLIDPNPAEPDQAHTLPYPYAACSAPITAGLRRFGAVTVLRRETNGPYPSAELAELEDIGHRLGEELAALANAGVSIAAGPTPILVPPESDDAKLGTPGWGVPGVPASAGTSMMYPVRRLAESLNRATTMGGVVAAAQPYVMSPLRAQSLVLMTASEGRLWVLGHSGDSSTIVRSLHGARMDDRTPATEAFQGRSLFVPADTDVHGEPIAQTDVRAYLPLVGDGQFVDGPASRDRRVVAVCCLTFETPREFPPEERALLGMMAGLLGAAVERISLSTQQRDLAQYLQHFLLPSQLPDLPRLATTARYRPGITSKVGGDWYDVIRIAGDRAVLVVGDVEGHSMESAAVMGQVRTALASYAAEGHQPTTVIDRTARLLSGLGTDLMVTCCVVALDTVAGTAEVALAGHPAPLVRRPDGSTGILRAPANVPLGVGSTEIYRGQEHTVEPGSIMMLYTNGLVGWEAADPEAVVQQQLLTSGRSGPANDLERLADLAVTEDCPGRQRSDDAVLLLARYEAVQGQDEPRVAGLHIQRRDLRGVKTARTFVRDRLGSWGLQDMSDALELMVSEIVTNALVHAGSDVDVRLRAFEDQVRLEVRDSDSNPPVPSPLALAEEENAEAEHGRGMLIVEALAEDWNSSPNGRGKTVALSVPIT
ncbi:SpoIIE family protein phosphatase [Streptomyces sp. NPDC051362]|uniref:SpoIIE family protein phosphatase n=1 Tax=Streptomyces sp. NPDC051362 TaxID=3365651 RepID=UPI00379D416E